MSEADAGALRRRETTAIVARESAGAWAGAWDAERRDALAGRLFQAMLGTMDLLSMYLGDRLGLYRALAEAGPASAAAVAARTGTHERDVREWLEQQAVTGAVLRPATLQRYAAEAGFRGLEVLGIEHDLFRLYRLLG
ncbi:MAG TPA: hypothetical protein VHS99_23375 [Chloroflexota bacterium]|jgi:hypothetical protein|nr:hypothetical protein [Chloroflexota bacterium]